MAGRKKLDRTNLHARVAHETGDKLKQIAQTLGYIHGDEGSTGQLLDAIADGELNINCPQKIKSNVNNNG
ncbi:MAG: hypothetical protein HC903_26765 [Methylacidiphilales bacterium]|nr:hypothetical protein [Candidatus Methylacidiphilales bacterium]